MKTRPQFLAAAVLAILVACLATCARAAEPLTEDQRAVLQYYAACAAASGIIAGQMADGPGAAHITQVGQWYASPLPDGMVEAALKQMQREYNDGLMTWDEMVTFGAECAADRQVNREVWRQVFGD